MPEAPQFDIKSLSKKDLESFEFFKKRKLQLLEVKKDVYGTNLDELFADADRDYVPHRLTLTKGKKTLAEDENLGWRGTSSLVQLGSNKWQSDVAQPNPYIKIQIAQSILFDQNPTGIFTPGSKKYTKTTELMKQLYSRSWDFAKSKQQLKLFVFNLCKYGWAIGRTYPLRIERKVNNLVQYDDVDPSKSVYEEKDVVEFNDIYRENIDPNNAWIDDMAKPNNDFSMRDWMWRKVYSMDSAEEEFGKWPNWKNVQPGGNTQEKLTSPSGTLEKKFQDTDLVEVFFYENRLKDLFIVEINGVPVVMSPLPISDAQGHKKLSVWQTYWNLRHAESPYGIGIYEAIRYDNGLLDRIRNMTIDQLTLSIYKMFFYQGTQALTETGDIRISPGIGKQTLDPKNINWMEVPGPGKDAYEGIQMFKADIDASSGIGDPLTGQVTGKTAFELAQAKESALKRLKTPLDNIVDALTTEGYITVSLIQLLYSIPETYQISDPKLIDDYLGEIQSDPELFDRIEEGQFVAKVFREFPLNLDKDEKGNLIETKDTQFFRVKPSGLTWEGIVNIKPQSVLSPSKQVDKALDLEMYNMLIPLFAQPPQIYKKAAENICKLYDKDPKDILPDGWLQEQQPQNTNLIIPADQMQQGQPQQAQQVPQAQTVVPPSQVNGNQQNQADQLIQQATGQ